MRHQRVAATERRPRKLRYLPIVLLTLLFTACNQEDLPQNTLEPAGPLARDIDGLWNLVFWIAVVIFVLVQAALIISIVRYRRRPDGTERPIKQVHGNTRLEVIWTIIPAVILGAIAVPTVATLFDLRERPANIDVEVNVIGHQWWWEFEYPEYGFVTANELHIPAGETVYLTMTSADVIHSFWVPKLNGKRDVVPGRVSNLALIADEPTDPDKPLLGQCAEFCGLAHADMRVKVFVHTPEDFEAWARAQAQPAVIPTEGLAAEGFETFGQICAACHVIDGTEYQVNLAPNLTHFASRTSFGGASFDNTEEHLRQWLRNPASLKPMDPDRNDIPAGRILGMPNFGLDEGQIDGLIALLEGLE